MIDEELLQQLGWSKDLISEVTRVRDAIYECEPKIAPIKEPRFTSQFRSSSSIHYQSEETTTTPNLKIFWHRSLLRSLGDKGRS